MRPLDPSAPPPGFMSSYWTDGEIILRLDLIIRGAPIPDDVIVDNPYLYDPSNFPDGAWFLVRKTEEKETKHGLWRAKGSACEIFANSAICGWRTTFEFSQVQAPIEQKTVWMMQEYKVTPKGQHDKTNSQESALCRVFSCCNEINNETKPEHENKINNEENPEKNNDLDTWGLLSLWVPDNPHTSSNDGQYSIGEPEVNSQTEVVGSSVVDKSQDHSVDDRVSDLDYILNGEYLELNDLGAAASHSSSSGNSSRLSLESDECFDSLALLRDLDDEKKDDLNGKGSSGNYNIMMSIGVNNVVVQPAPLEYLVKGSDAAAKETQQVADNNKSKAHSEPSPDQAAKRLKAERTDEGPSHSRIAAISSSSSSNNNNGPGHEARREKKRAKKFTKYLCFMPF